MLRDRLIIEKKLKIAGYSAIPLSHRFLGNGGLVSYSRIPVLRSEFIRFTDQGAWFSQMLADRLLGKGMLIADVLWGNARVCIVNTHLVSHYGDLKEQPKTPYLSNQVNQIVAELKSRILFSAPLILAGDFNFSPGSVHHSKLTQELGVKDCLGDSAEPTYSATNANRGTDFFLKQSGSLRTDYIFHRNLPARRVAGSVIFKELREYKGEKYHISDHFGVMLEIQRKFQ